MKSLMLAAVGVLALTACKNSNESYQLIPPEKPAIVFGKTEVTKDGLVINIDKRVDILFVIDDSLSMEVHQQNLSKNIDAFVKGLANKSKDIDFHIGVTTVHDQTRYLDDNSVVPRVCRFPDGHQETFWEDVGTLKTLKKVSANERFVTNSEGFKDILAETLKVGAQPFYGKTGEQKDGKWSCQKGPEQEDLFSPMLTVLSENAPKVNAGFRRPGAFLVVILVTDAKDASGMNADSVYEQLQMMTGDRVDGQRKLRVFAVAMNQFDKVKSKKLKDGTYDVFINGKKCKPDPAFGLASDGSLVREVPDHEVIKLARLTGDNEEDGRSQVLSICSDFGPALSNFSDKIVRDVVPDLIVQVPQLSDQGNAQLRVRIGDGEDYLVRDQDWEYNNQTNEVIIKSSQVDWSLHKGQQIHVEFSPVDPDAPTTKPITD